jgi:hypothetical protein
MALDGITASESSAAMVAHYAPCLRGGVPLPNYQQPAVTWTTTPACDPAFAACMRATWARLDLRDRTLFSEDESLVLRYHRMHGVCTLYTKGLSGVDRLRSRDDRDSRSILFQNDLANLLGDKLFTLLGPAQVARWFPYHDVSVRHRHPGTAWTLQCDSLQTHTTAEGQTLYHAAAAPTALLRGQRRVVAFSAHAIARMTDRLVWGPTRAAYANLGDVFTFLNATRYFEPTRLHPQQDALALYNTCVEHWSSYQYVAKVLEQADPQTRYAYRMGYCPVVVAGDCWLATTTLAPGHAGTPEYGALLKASLAPGVKERLLAQCQTLSYTQTLSTQDFSLLRWFHRHGVPQVIPCPPGLFATDV